MGTVVIAAGGTGGHVYPALAVAAELAGLRPGTSAVFMGTAAGLEARVVPPAGFPFHAVRTAPWRRGRPWTLVSAAVNSFVGAFRAGMTLKRLKAGAVFSTGGYAAVPVLLAAAVLRVPVVLHEPNARPGLVNRLFGLVARRVTVGSQAAVRAFPARKTAVTGVPVRRSLLAGGRDEARGMLGLGREFTVLVLGGSQGAGALNECLMESFPLLRKSGIPFAFIWLTGRRDFERAREIGAGAGFPVVVFEYLDDMGPALRAADLAVARSGAGTVGELLATGLPAIFVPYPYAADNHQEANARALEDRGAAIVLAEAGLTPKALAFRLVSLAGDPAVLGRLAAGARKLGKPDAARVVAGEVLDALGEGNRA